MNLPRLYNLLPNHTTAYIYNLDYELDRCTICDNYASDAIMAQLSNLAARNIPILRRPDYFFVDHECALPLDTFY